MAYKVIISSYWFTLSRQQATQIKIFASLYCECLNAGTQQWGEEGVYSSIYIFNTVTQIIKAPNTSSRRWTQYGWLEVITHRTPHLRGALWVWKELRCIKESSLPAVSFNFPQLSTSMKLFCIFSFNFCTDTHHIKWLHSLTNIRVLQKATDSSFPFQFLVICKKEKHNHNCFV